MRNATLIALIVLLLAPALVAQEQPTTAPAEVDLGANPQVQEALDAHEGSVAAIDADYAKKLEAARAACVAALRRAEAVSRTRGRADEALTIKALAESIQREASDPAPGHEQAAPAQPLVGRWIRADRSHLTLHEDGRATASWSGSTAKWHANKAGTMIEIRWAGGRWIDTLELIAPGQWVWKSFEHRKYKRQMAVTPPAEKPAE